LGEGEHKITTTETDKGGNKGKPTPPTTVTVDTTPPATPPVETSVESNSTLTVKGQTEANATVAVTFPDGTVKTVVADSNGNYTVTSDAPQATGDVSVVATDSAGNSSTPSSENFTQWYQEDNTNGSTFTYGDTNTPSNQQTTVHVDQDLTIEREENPSTGDIRLNVSTPTLSPAPAVVTDAPAGCDTQSYSAFTTLYKSTGEIETGYGYADTACNGISDATVYDGKRLRFVPGTKARLEKTTDKGGMVIIIDAELKKQRSLEKNNEKCKHKINKNIHTRNTPSFHTPRVWKY